ncbi:hypothetical protein LZ32DRAFT_695284 [Colletotrichum eremochloae]|nr:hypothetical protein LZ32DRAFT_695284 [Colletotrichum eremochloae]
MNLRIFLVLLMQIAVCWAAISKSQRKGALHNRQVRRPDCAFEKGACCAAEAKNATVCSNMQCAQPC